MRTSRWERTRWRRAPLAAFALILGVVGVAGVQPAAHAEEPAKVLLLLDVSGSMNEQISSGGTKFTAAKAALKQVADALPSGTQVGLRVYGSEISEDQKVNPKACTDTKLVLPIAPLDKAKMYAAVDSFKAVGETPIAYSLGKSVADLGDSGKRVLVLISDGQESCESDPCPSARKLANSGVDLQFNAIGLAVNAKAREQLQCIADAGDGNYYDAGNTSDLNDALRKITQRALRPFQTSGTPVVGTEDAASAPEVQAGQYKDNYDPDTVPRFYKINRQPGSAVRVSMASIVRAFPTQNSEGWDLALTTLDGQPCATAEVKADTYHATTVAAGAIRSDGADPNSATPADDRCGSDPQLLLSMSRESYLNNTKQVPVEITIFEEPPITNLAALPAALESYTGKAEAVGAKTPAQSAVGGTAFSNAPTITPGSWTDSMAVGETVFYRVRVEPGQRLRVTANTPVANTGWGLDSAEHVLPYLTIWSADRVELTTQSGDLTSDQRVNLTAASPEVRVRNREAAAPSVVDPDWRWASVPGDYFVAVQLDPVQYTLAGRVMQIRLNVAVDGQPTGLPEYAKTAGSAPPPGASPTADPGQAGSSSSQRGLPMGLLIGGGVVLAVALVTAGVLLGRRTKRA